MNQTAFQDMLEGNRCFGCGKDNPQGLQLKSRWEGDSAVATFTPWPQHMAGPPHVLNGGIIATLIDCHGICTAVADAYRAEGKTIADDPAAIWFVTGALSVSYKRPTPLGAPVRLEARVAERKGKKAVVAVELSSGGEICATGEVIAIRVPAEWRGLGHASQG